MEDNKGIHLLELCDAHAQSLEIILSGLNQSIEDILELNPDMGYDIEEHSEFTLGLMMLAFHHYINMTCREIINALNLDVNYEVLIKESEIIDNSGFTKLELIIALATYFKHRDFENLNDKKYRKILDAFDLLKDTNWEMLFEYYPVSMGYEILTPTYQSDEIVSCLTKWRDSLWKKYKKEYFNKQKNQ